MIGTTHIYQPWVQLFARFGLFISCTLVLLAGSGCAGRKVKAKPFPWSTFAYTRPLSPSLAPTQRHESDDDPLADATLEVAPPPSGLVIARNVPPRPRLPVVSSSPNDNDDKPEIPQIAPQLTAAEASAAQQQTSQSLNIAEHNIGSAQGKTLNPKQQDLASKVRSFMAEARDAANTGDWMRARAASKKAEVLSQELASSL